MLNRLGYDKLWLQSKFDIHFKSPPLTIREKLLVDAIFRVIEDNNDEMKSQLDAVLNSLKNR